MDCDCKKIHEELVFLYADNEMGQEMLVTFQRHIADCPGCAAEMDLIRRMKQALGRLGGEGVDPAVTRLRAHAAGLGT